jgi:hypothetical protein
MRGALGAARRGAGSTTTHTHEPTKSIDTTERHARRVAARPAAAAAAHRKGVELEHVRALVGTGRRRFDRRSLSLCEGEAILIRARSFALD